MIMKRFTLSGCYTALTLAIVLTAGTASAQVAITDVPAKGYADGKASGLSPQTDGEDFDCAVYWDVWHTAFISKIMPKEIEDALPVQLSDPASDSAKMAWRNKVAEAQETTSMLAMISIIEKTPIRNGFQAKMEAGLQGDADKLFSVTQSLGICQKPGL
jgi:hypothetical protein